MNLSRCAWVTLLFVLLFITSCSKNSNSPVTPSDSENKLALPLMQSDKTSSGHQPLGAFSATFNIDTLEASVAPNRSLNAHHNYTGMIPDPLISINSWDPVEKIIDVDITLHNPTWTTVYDVRLIIFTDDAGHKLINADNWTPLWDIPGGQIANPFKAYAKYEINRAFTGLMWHQENFQIKCPNSNFDVQFVIDGCYPGNCDEPFEISNFEHGNLYESPGSSTTISVDVFDWQDDITTVELYCQQITGQPEIEFTHLTGHTWQTQLVNTTGASSGYHVGIIAADSGGLRIYKSVKITIWSGTSIEHNPELIGKIPYMSECKYMDVNGNYAYISGGHTGIRIVDISDPLNPEIIGAKHVESTGKILYKDNYIFLQTNGSYLSIYDVSNPEEIVFINRTLRTINDWLLVDDTLYVTSSMTFTKFYDVSDPTDWVLIGSTSGSRSAPYFDVGGNLIVRASNDGGIYVYDLSINPQAPPLVGSNPNVPNCRDIDLFNNHAYVSCGHDGIYVVDLNDPTSPEIVNIITDLGLLSRLSISGNMAYVGGREEMLIFDISDPLNLILTNVYDSNYGFSGILIHNEMAFLSGYASWGMQIVDISDPGLPVEINTIWADGRAHSIAVSGDIALVGHPLGLITTSPDIRIVDISVPENPSVTTHIPETYYVNDIEINGDYAYVSTGIVWDVTPYLCAFHILDISNPFAPDKLCEKNLGVPTPRGLDVFGNYLCISRGEKCAVYDITNKSSPIYTSTFNTNDSYISDVKIAGELTYTIGKDYLTICDSTDPSSVSIISEFPTTFSRGFIDMDNVGNVVYLLNRDTYPDTSNLLSIDVTDPSNPVLMDTFILQDGANNFKLEGNYIYTVNESSGLEILDITNPSNILLESSLELGLDAYDIDVQDNFAYIANGYMGILVVKLWD